MIRSFTSFFFRSGYRVVVFAAVCLTGLTIVGLFGVFLQLEPFTQVPNLPVYLGHALTVQLLVLFAIIAYRFARLYHSRAGSRLQKRMVGFMALLVSVPTLVISIFSLLFLDIGLENWISGQVKTALEESQNVADTYLEEHRNILANDILSIARAFDHSFQSVRQTNDNIEQFLRFNTDTRQITQALIFRLGTDGRRQVIARAGFSASLEAAPLNPADIQRAAQNQVVLILSDKVDYAKGLVKLRLAPDLYLYAGRFVSPQVVRQTKAVSGAVRRFQLLEQQLQELKLGFMIAFVLFALLCIILSLYWSQNLARSIAAPIMRLTQATQKMADGDWDVRVNIHHLPADETAELIHAFNDMTEKLKEANQDIVRRRDFTETILRSVSTGILSLNANGTVISINQRAMDILSIEKKSSEHFDIFEFLPELTLLPHTDLSHVREQRFSVVTGQGKPRAVMVRVGYMHKLDQQARYIVSLDDVTDLENAERMAAWSEVAKRIAHEIRNPLTPIRLATERLRRKYPPLLSKLRDENQGVSDRDVEAMQQSTATILRQVDSIAAMVREFSDFARMPKANRQPEDIVELCREAVFIEQNRGHHLLVAFDMPVQLPEEGLMWFCDRHQIMQLLINLLKNAAEAILEHNAKIPQNYDAVTLQLRYDGQNIVIKVIDRGPGWPAEREKLFDPYHTLRKQGTGLGLAIVKRIAFEHDGECILEDTIMNDPSQSIHQKVDGATVHLRFQRQSMDSSQDVPHNARSLRVFA